MVCTFYLFLSFLYLNYLYLYITELEPRFGYDSYAKLEVEVASELTNNAVTSVDVSITQIVDSYISTGQSKPYYEEMYYVSDTIDTAKLLVILFCSIVV